MGQEITILNRVVREGPIEKGTSKQGPEVIISLPGREQMPDCEEFLLL